jgi:uncharacterized protein (DUF58 family)
MVKEFDTGSGLNLAFMLQRTLGTDVGPAGGSTFEAACGHSLFLASRFIERGASIWFAGLEREEASMGHPEARARAIREVLTDIQPAVPQSLANDVSRQKFRDGTTLVLLLSVQDDELPGALQEMPAVRKVCLVYDAHEYDPKSKKPSAANSAYLAQLEMTGAEVILMPHVEAVE